VILATVALAILFMGIASPLFTRRMEASVDNIVEQTQAPVIRNASSRSPILCCVGSHAPRRPAANSAAPAAPPAGRQGQE
jgi:hypothetical protein